MTIDDILKLVNAGFTAQQIGQMIKAAPAEPAPAPAEAAPAEPEPAPEPSAAPQAEPEDLYGKLAAQLDAKFTELAESLRIPANPSINDIKPLGVDDIIRNFFKEQ